MVLSGHEKDECNEVLLQKSVSCKQGAIVYCAEKAESEELRDEELGNNEQESDEV